MHEPLMLTWYVLARDCSADLGSRWLTACREHLPDAVPVRYDDSEPLRRRLEPGTDEAFAHFVDATQGLVHARGRRRELEGSLTGGVPTPRWGPVRAVTLSVGAEDDALPLFVAVAQDLGVLYAHAVPMSERSSGFLAALGHWRGLPPQAPPWSWFGPRYARLTRRHPSGGEPSGAGLLHRTDVPGERGWVPPAWQAPDGPDLARRASRMPDGLRLPWTR